MAQRCLAALLDDSLLAKRRGDGYLNTTWITVLNGTRLD